MTAISKSKNGFSSISYLWIYCGCHSNILIISMWYYQKIEVNWWKREGTSRGSCTIEVLLTFSDRHKLLHFVPNIDNIATCGGFYLKCLFFWLLIQCIDQTHLRKYFMHLLVCVSVHACVWPWEYGDQRTHWRSGSLPLSGRPRGLNSGTLISLLIMVFSEKLKEGDFPGLSGTGNSVA